MHTVQVAKVSLLSMIEEPVGSQEIYIKREYTADDISDLTLEDEKETLVHR